MFGGADYGTSTITVGSCRRPMILREKRNQNRGRTPWLAVQIFGVESATRIGVGAVAPEVLTPLLTGASGCDEASFPSRPSRYSAIRTRGSGHKHSAPSRHNGAGSL